MSSRLFNMLVVDDFLIDMKEILVLLGEGLLKESIKIHRVQVVENVPARLEGLVSITALQFLKERHDKGEALDFALLDREYEEEFGHDIHIGPRKLIDAIKKFFPKCQILLLTKKGPLARHGYAEINGVPYQKFRMVSKHEIPLAVKVIHDLVKDWVVNFLEDNVTKIDVDTIAKKIRKGETNLPHVIIGGDEWKANTYLFPYYLYLQNPGNPDEAAMTPGDILRILQKQYQPKLKAWHMRTDNFRYPLAKYYDRYKEWPERSQEKLNGLADKFINEYLRAELNRTDPPENRYNFKGDIQADIDGFDFVPQFETILISRRIAIGLRILGYEPKAIWFAFSKHPVVYSLLDKEEKKKASPNQLFPTYYALSFKEDFPKNADHFDTYINLLVEEIDWLKQTFDLTAEDLAALNIFLDDTKSILASESNHPLVAGKQKVQSYANAGVCLNGLMLLLKQSKRLEYFLETAQEDIDALNCSPKLKKYLAEIIDNADVM